MSIWVRLNPTAVLLAFGVIIYISQTCKQNIFCSYYASILLFAFHPYYAKIYAGKIDLS